MGRVKTISSYEDRIIDIDIILYNELVMDKKDLIIPHPEYKRRDFVLSPMDQIGEYLDPQVFLSCGQLLK
jgi:2-amino-4-hydroxy-6-hydroxymethyldihydropteridine diphosphokinase